jgi:predicted CXXCH cytochrome family protein
VTKRRRLALLGTAGLLWLFAAALPALADGGPHIMSQNNGLGGISGDCASCHRAHTAQAANLLSNTVPALCTNCHNGTKATTDVVDGVQYAPTGVTGTYGSTVLGALRGGGFNYALIDSENAARYAYSPGGLLRFKGHVGALASGQKTTSNHQGVGTVWGNGSTQAGVSNPGASGVVLDCAKCHNPHGNGQYRILATDPGESWSNGAKTSLTTLNGAITLGATTVVVSATPNVAAGTGLPFTISIDSEQLTVTAVSGTSWTVARGANSTAAAAHANLASVMLVTAGWTPATEEVQVAEVDPQAIDPLTQVRNYTIRPSSDGLTSGVIGTASEGDYWRSRFDPAGTGTWLTTGFGPDEMNSGWDGVSAVNAAQNGGVQPSNSNGLMTAWCLQCHTRYSGLETTMLDPDTGFPVSYPSSVVPMQPIDPVFTYKHGTANVGCEQCHVSHGSNAVLAANGSMQLEDPAGTIPAPVAGAGTGTSTSADSRLLKISNLGTCQMCHDPTKTLTTPSYTGPLPTPGL